MKRQKSFQNDLTSLYLVATPIGNLNEMTPRAIEVLKQVSVIACEDTRTTMVLLKHFGIETKVISHHTFNEKESASGIVKLLESGQDVALVSDAGYPLISDPGYIVVQEVLSAGYNVIPISGSSAALNALVASGLVTQPFIFYGFLPLTDKDFTQTVNQLKAYPYTLIFYEAPHRIQKTIARLLPLLGDRQAVIAREITKKFEEFLRGRLSELGDIEDELKGEIVLVIEGKAEEKAEVVDLAEVNERIQAYVDTGISASEAIKQVAKEVGMNKHDIYNSYHNKGEAS
ncbi:MAG: 16S rRNA (cytidine(1402)-2'-O)-methyltransferase [Erysipelotrichaceae bacterium]|nr:16S rRNA (cytidine(1402)-2'-O)-methyltransferase [Erysipelotrichaceae bacterium]